MSENVTFLLSAGWKPQLNEKGKIVYLDPLNGSLVLRSTAARQQAERNQTGDKNMDENIENTKKVVNGYVCFYKGLRLEIYAETQLKARDQAVKEIQRKYPRRTIKPWDVSCTLAEKDGVVVSCVATE